MCSCWDLQPKERPTAQTILRKIIRVRQEGMYQEGGREGRREREGGGRPHV